MVLTCKKCNGDADRAYEWRAVDPRNESIEEFGVGECPGHGLRVQPISGLLIPQDDAILAQTDIKSAFLIAFATLGYRWSTAEHIAPVRRAIEAGQLPPAGSCAIVRFDDELEGDLVLELGDPAGAVAVRSESRVGVIFPGPGNHAVVLPRGRVTLRPYRWPVINGPHTQLGTAHKNGTLFHLDLCSRPHGA